MVVFDTTAALLFLRPGTNPPLDPATGNPVEHAEARIALLVETLGKVRTRIIIPTPALSELLVYAGAGTAELVTRLTRSATFGVRPFDTRAAIELAVMTRSAIDRGDKKGGVEAPWNKIKFDRQIVAIARVAGATAIYSDDHQLRAFAEQQGLTVIGLADLLVPDSVREPELPLLLPPEPNVDAQSEEQNIIMLPAPEEEALADKTDAESERVEAPATPEASEPETPVVPELPAGPNADQEADRKA
jgi:hypothetical protein